MRLVTREEGELLAGTDICVCGGRLTVAWGGRWGIESYVLRCGNDSAHGGIHRAPDPVGKRMMKMAQLSAAKAPPGTAIVSYQTEYGEVSLSTRLVQDLLCANATEQEARLFIRACMYVKANPFIREAYLIKYDERAPAQIVFGRDFYQRRAEQHPQYAGYEAGIVVKRGEKVMDIDGALPLPDDVVLGAWSKCYRKDRARPLHLRVSYKEYDRGRALWKERPATMIRKVAVVQGLRESFPDLFAGTVEASEVSVELPQDEVPVPAVPAQEAVAVEAPPAAQVAPTPGPPVRGEPVETRIPSPARPSTGSGRTPHATGPSQNLTRPTPVSRAATKVVPTEGPPQSQELFPEEVTPRTQLLDVLKAEAKQKGWSEERLYAWADVKWGVKLERASHDRLEEAFQALQALPAEQ